MRRILVPTDFSEHALYAAKAAAAIVRKSEGRLFLLHVLNIPSYLNAFRIDFDQTNEGYAAISSVSKQFHELVENDFFTDVNTAEVLLYNGVHENILQFAKENSIELIVMGTYGVSGIQEYFIGSNTQKLVRISDCPVLTVKNDIENFNPQKIVFASDFEKSVYGGFEKILRFAEDYKAEIHLLKVITREHFETSIESQKSMDDLISEFKLRNITCHIYNDEVVDKGILHFCNKIGADLVALTTEGRKKRYQLLNESIAERLVNRSDIPVLIVKKEGVNY